MKRRANHKTRKSVKVFTQPGCGVCKSAKEYLASRGVAFEELDVSTDEEALEALTVQYKSMGTPTIVIGDRVLVGFDREKLDTALAALA